MTSPTPWAAAAPVFAALALSFVAVAFAGTGRDGAAQALFGAAAIAAVTAAVATSSTLRGGDRLAALGACAALAGAACYGAAEVGAVVAEKRALALFVAPGSGLATVWWWGHTKFSDRMRWVPSLIGAGWNLLTALASTLLAVVALDASPTAWDEGEAARGGTLFALGYGLAAVGALAAVGLVLTGAVGSARRARALNP